MDTELPDLVARGVRLAPVLVGACLWQHVPEIARVQWLHGPDPNDALSLAGNRAGERDQQLAQLCNRLVVLPPDPPAAPPHHHRPYGPSIHDRRGVAAVGSGATP